MPRPDLSLRPLRLRVRHRCDGSRETGVTVLFNDFDVLVDAFPGRPFQGCPFCWSSVFTLRGAWWENYRRRAPVATPEACAAAAVDAVRRLERPGCPDDALCSHHGVYAPPLVQVSNKGPHLQVIMYQSLYPRPAALHLARAEAVAAALVTSVRETWNGLDGHNGISVILGRSAPDALVCSINNYLSLKDVFSKDPAVLARFRVFSDWFNAPLGVDQ